MAGFAYRFLGLNSILSFWIAYILTRPLGASLGDLLTQPFDSSGLGIGSQGGLDLGKGTVNLVFFACIIGLVGFLSFVRVDRQGETLVSDD